MIGQFPVTLCVLFSSHLGEMLCVSAALKGHQSIAHALAWVSFLPATPYEAKDDSIFLNSAS